MLAEKNAEKWMDMQKLCEMKQRMVVFAVSRSWWDREGRHLVVLLLLRYHGLQGRHCKRPASGSHSTGSVVALPVSVSESA